MRKFVPGALPVMVKAPCRVWNGLSGVTAAATGEPTSW